MMDDGDNWEAVHICQKGCESKKKKKMSLITENEYDQRVLIVTRFTVVFPGFEQQMKTNVDSETFLV